MIGKGKKLHIDHMEVRVLGIEDGSSPGTSHRSRYLGH